jgi:hypothetical protein
MIVLDTVKQNDHTFIIFSKLSVFVVFSTFYTFEWDKQGLGSYLANVMPSPVMRQTMARQLVIECLGHRSGYGSFVGRMPDIDEEFGDGSLDW